MEPALSAGNSVEENNQSVLVFSLPLTGKVFWREFFRLIAMRFVVMRY